MGSEYVISSFHCVVFLVAILAEKSDGLLNLAQSNVESVNQSSQYKSQFCKISAENAIDGSYGNWSTTCNCSATKVDKEYEEAWWTIIFNVTTEVQQITLSFREQYLRHWGYSLFVTNTTAEVHELFTGIQPVYHDRSVYNFSDGSKPSIQASISFPDRYIAKQIYVYVNRTEPVNDEYDYRNAVFTLCDIKIFGCPVGYCGENCDLLAGQCRNSGLYSTTYNLRNDRKNLTLYCHHQYLFIVNITDPENETLLFELKRQCDWRKECQIDLNQGQTVSYLCDILCNISRDLTEGLEPIGFDDNENKTLFKINETATLKCAKNYRHECGDLTRTCQESGKWSGSPPKCTGCKCPCERMKHQIIINDIKVLEDKIEHMKQALQVHEQKLSRQLRKKSSANDNRQSATGIGVCLGIGILVVTTAFMIAVDMPILYRHIRYGPGGGPRNF